MLTEPETPGRQEHQLVRVARIQRQVDDFAVFHHLADRRRSRLEQGRLAGNGYGITQFADLQCDIDRHVLVYLEFKGLPDSFPESTRLDGQRVLSGREVYEHVPARDVGGRGLPDISFRCESDDFGPRNRRL